MFRHDPNPKIFAIAAVLSFIVWGAGVHTGALAKHRNQVESATAPSNGNTFDAQLHKCLSDIEYDKPFAPQLDALLIRASMADPQKRKSAQDKLAAALTVLTDQQIDQGKFAEASRNLQHINKIMEGRKHGYWPATIAAANLAAKQSNHEKAIDLYNNAIRAMREQGLKNTRDEAIANLLLGDLYLSKGWNQQAEQVYKRSLDIFGGIESGNADSDACSVLRLCTQLTALRQKLKHSESAINVSLDSALRAANRIKGKESKDDLWVLDKLANCCKVQKRQQDYETLIARNSAAQRRLHAQSIDKAK